MVGPGFAADVTRRKPALMRHDLVQCDIAFAALGEFGQVIGDPIHERQLALLDQGPDRRTG
jgi:hypothetical protein